MRSLNTNIALIAAIILAIAAAVARPRDHGGAFVISSGAGSSVEIMARGPGDADGAHGQDALDPSVSCATGLCCPPPDPSSADRWRSRQRDARRGTCIPIPAPPVPENLP